MTKIIDDLINQLSSLPGFSQRSVIRAVSHMLSHEKECLIPVYSTISRIMQDVKKCPICWSLDLMSPCEVCSGSNKRNRGQICVIENLGALWSIERRRHYNGMYHVLGGILSAAENITPSSLNIQNLLNRISESEQDLEIIIAVQPSSASGITIEYIIQSIREISQQTVISRVAQGLQSGTKIEGADDETIISAFMSRVVIA